MSLRPDDVEVRLPPGPPVLTPKAAAILARLVRRAAEAQARPDAEVVELRPAIEEDRRASAG